MAVGMVVDQYDALDARASPDRDVQGDVGEIAAGPPSWLSSSIRVAPWLDDDGAGGGVGRRPSVAETKRRATTASPAPLRVDGVGAGGR